MANKCTFVSHRARVKSHLSLMLWDVTLSTCVTGRLQFISLGLVLEWAVGALGCRYQSFISRGINVIVPMMILMASG